jgi:regulator of sirC expression with transglutaminase-like and TPR domain
MERDKPARQQFTEIMARGEETLDLAEAALLIAEEEYPDLDTRFYLGRLDRMADEVRSRMCEEEGPRRRLEALNRYLFESLGFKGNLDDYYDPRNSFLNEVLDRRTGIPITISTVYLEVGWRVGMPLHGVGFPGHFLVKYVDSNGEIVIDPFNRGAILTEDDCQGRLDQVYGRRVQFQSGFLAASTKRHILIRILTNLKGIYLGANDYQKALAAVDRILIIDPNLGTEIRDRGTLRMQLKHTAQGIADLERYLTMNPTTDDFEEVRRRLRDWRQAQASLN